MIVSHARRFIFVKTRKKFDLALEADERAEIEYQIRPTQRGQYEIELAELAIRSPLGLW